MYKQDLALNNLQVLICHKTKPTNQPTWIPRRLFCAIEKYFDWNFFIEEFRWECAHMRNLYSKAMISRGGSGGVAANELDYDIVVSEFKLQLSFYVYF